MGLDPWHLTTPLALETADKTTPEDEKNSLSSKFDTFYCQGNLFPKSNPNPSCCSWSFFLIQFSA